MAAFDGYDDVIDALDCRKDWEDRQSQWYRMRHMGLRRRSKPHPGAADMHFPLIDALIERLKAFYFQQLYATENIASFISLKPQDAEMTTACASWFDYRLKQKSNLERAALTAIDYMLLSGFCPLKPFWDEARKSLRFAPINPIYLIVPKYTISFDDAAFVVHVLHLSESDYKRNEEFDQDKDLIKLISGKGDEETGGNKDDKYWREGITCGNDDKEIVLWEIHEKKKNGIEVSTYSPLQPDESKKIRKPFMLPYDQGEFKNKGTHCFSLIQMEMKDEGWYSPRGLSEINAPFESSLCKMWNQQHDYMDYMCRPTFSSDRDLGNISNIRMLPGQLLPPGVTPNPAGQPPVAFDEQIQFLRGLAEYRTNVPDLGNATHMAHGSKGYGGDKTATEVNAIVGISSIADDMRTRVFRMGFSDLLRKAWSIYLQYDKDSLDYVLDNSMSQVSKEALHDKYLIVPSGSADSWNKGLQMQKAIARKQMFTGDPNIEQGELTKSCLEVDEPGLIKRLYRDQGLQQQDQAEQQAIETVLILNNFSAPIHPGDDDKVHLASLAQFGQKRMEERNPITPPQANAFGQHIEGHLQQLQQKKDKGAAQYRVQMKPFLEMLMQIAQSQPQPAPNVVPMPQQGSPPTPAGQVPAGNAASPVGASGAPPATGKDGSISVKLPSPTINIPPTVVNVPAPVVNVPKAIINIAPTPVSITPAPAPIVNVEQPKQIKEIKLQRDSSGKLVGAKVS